MWYLKAVDNHLLFIVKYFESCPKGCPYRRSDGSCTFSGRVKDCYYDDVYKVPDDVITILVKLKNKYNNGSEQLFLSMLYEEEPDLLELIDILDEEDIPIGTERDFAQLVSSALDLIDLR